ARLPSQGPVPTRRSSDLFEAAHVGNAKRAEIEDRASAFRDYIGARAAFKDAGVDRDATARIVPLLDARELPRQFVNGVDAFLWRSEEHTSELQSRVELVC